MAAIDLSRSVSQIVAMSAITASTSSAAARPSRVSGAWCRSRTRGCLVPVGLYSARASVQPGASTEVEEKEPEAGSGQGKKRGKTAGGSVIPDELNQAVRKTAATFAPRPSGVSKNPAPPGSPLYKVFEAQACVAMVLGGALSFNLLFPSDHPDLWRLMGMWSVWMFTVPSLRARDCSKQEKEALNYLFVAIPLINVALPFVWKSFPAIWCADVLAFFAFYAWKLEWFAGDNKEES